MAMNCQMLTNLTESQEQRLLFKWWAFQYPQWDLLLFHIPNGGLRNKIVAHKLRLEGVKAGVADVFLAIGGGTKHGLFIEMKRKKGGTQSKLQKEFEDAVTKQGYLYKVCHGFEAARQAITDYLSEIL